MAWMKISPVMLTKTKATMILRDKETMSGIFLLYENVDNGRIFLSFRTIDQDIVHYAIIERGGLFFFNKKTFQYLESIILYYRKFKLRNTKLTNQAVLPPSIKTQRSKRIANYLK